MQWGTAIRVFFMGTVVTGFVASALLSAQNQLPPVQHPQVEKNSSPELPADPNQFVRQAVYHSIEAENNDHTHWRYRFHREDDKNNYDRDVIETRDGELARTICIHGHPLTPDERQRDEERMRKLVNSEQERAERAKRIKDDGEKAQQMFKAIPDAFNFKYDGMEDGLVRLTFYPKPDYDPPSRELKVFRAMSGTVLIDPKEHRLAAIDGRLFEDVTFGWGFLARLHKGGSFRVTQREIVPGHWEIVGLDVDMSGHAILFKNISFKQHEVKSEFRRVPDSLTIAQAYQLLEKDEGAVSATATPGAAASQSQ